jgi:RNA polymerase sigma factor (TIGR02999 family)
MSPDAVQANRLNRFDVEVRKSVKQPAHGVSVSPMSEVSRILSAINQGDPHAASQLLPLVYDELRKLAAQRLARESPGQTLQPTALVHEAYLRLVGEDEEQHWDSRGHFFAAAAEAMRRILVESARRKNRVKHGGDLQRVDLDDNDVPVRPPPEEILALDEALTQLTEEDPEAAQVVQLHFFAGLSIEQAAEALGISRATAYRQWSYARAWLRCAIGGDAPEW